MTTTESRAAVGSGRGGNARRREARMTLQRLTRDESAPAAVSRTSLRAKPLMTNERLKVAHVARPSRAHATFATRHVDASPRSSGTFETLLGELTRVLSMSFDYTAALQ